MENEQNEQNIAPLHKIIGIIDIGSNSARLTIYQWHQDKQEYKYQTEVKVDCNLAKGMRTDGELDPERMQATIKALEHFRAVIENENIPKVYAVATAAMRAARANKDGRLFHQACNAALTHNIEIITGEEEARLSAMGILSAWPDAEGICADKGGGSTEVAYVKNGEVKETATMPLGSETLRIESKDNIQKAFVIAEKYLNPIKWLNNKGNGKTLYLIGGNWRAAAKVMIEWKGRPEESVHGFTLDVDEALDLARDITNKNPAYFQAMHNSIAKRAHTIALGACVLITLMKQVNPKEIVFSKSGLPDGIILDRHNKLQKMRKPRRNLALPAFV